MGPLCRNAYARRMRFDRLERFGTLGFCGCWIMGCRWRNITLLVSRFFCKILRNLSLCESVNNICLVRFRKYVSDIRGSYKHVEAG